MRAGIKMSRGRVEELSAVRRETSAGGEWVMKMQREVRRKQGTNTISPEDRLCKEKETKERGRAGKN